MEKEETNKKNRIMEWIPIIEKLIWPIFIILLLLVFKDKVNGLYNMATEGRSLEIGGWLKIGEQVKETTVQNFAPENSTIEAVEGESVMIEKGGNRALKTLQAKLKNGTIGRIDVMNIVDNKYYYKDMLTKYISTLGIKHIVFTKHGKFDGWMESSIFSGQLLMDNRDYYDYNELKGSLYGVKKEIIPPKMKTGEALSYMKKKGLATIPVVDGKTFKYFINKSDILTSIISSNILNKIEDDGK